MSSKAYREAVDYALALGLEDDGVNGEGHHQFRNPRTGACHSLSTTMPGNGRNLLNAKADLRRVAGTATRGRTAVEGERREKRKPAPDPERVAFEARRAASLKHLASKEAAAARDAELKRLAAAVADRQSELDEIARLMRQRPSG